MSSASDIIYRLSSCYDKALSSGDLCFFSSTVHKYVEYDVEYQIRLCPALQKKHVAVGQEPAKPLDPFAPPYTSNLFIGEIHDKEGDQEYAVLLNKYSVVPRHFLLVTKEYQSQTSPLMPPDLLTAYSLLVAAQKAGQNLLAFYNCGDNSGASQPHKHLQFIPIEGDGPPIERLARRAKLETSDKPFSLTSLPYANHVYRLPQHMSSPGEIECVLSQTFLSLIDLGISTIRHDADYPAGKPAYNVLFTLEHMHLIPRRRETHILKETGEELSINSLGFAGMLLVKSEAELEAVKSEKVGDILKGVGLQSVHDLQVAGPSLEAPDEDAKL
jgi:ATP adenylyltransferase